MKDHKKSIKEGLIIDAAESVFGEVGFKNAKMEEIARTAGITKVTLYSYFQSKENLYLAVTYRALLLLIERYYDIIEKTKDKSGLESVMSILEGFMSFCEENYLYSEALLEYFALIRSTSGGTNEAKLTEAVKDSIYYVKLQDMHNLPFKLTVKEIERGKKDGSIKIKVDSMLCTLHGWTMALGYVKILSASGTNATPLFNVNLSDLKAFNLFIAKSMFSSKSFDG
ncbi:MAG: TetR/AcrR family transcriptional regulator [Saprospiraceae bacterium]|nr:MAG: TetR family transcriptional regulator [Bacteroidetes bacterium OLB9]MCO6464151.1 TetR/AcrR family transcriptional regulator [Saprospiraceae bacterium]MCZ2337613.1 TetR/AcrR family transcriptional regulator [Chitinophagales bacterium]